MKSCLIESRPMKSRPFKALAVKSKLTFLSLASLTLTAPAYPQARGGSAPGAPTGAPDSSLGPERTGDLGQPKPGDYLLGKVTVSGGDLPWDPIPATFPRSGKPPSITGPAPNGPFVIPPPKGPPPAPPPAPSNPPPADT